MKLNSNNLKTAAGNFRSRTNGAIIFASAFLKETETGKKAVAITLMTALLMPVFLFGGLVKRADAQSINLSSQIVQPPAPLAAPPAGFVYSSSDNFSAQFAATILSINAALTDNVVSLVQAFETPRLPEGFETAQPVSPATAFLFSVGDSIGSFLGFFSTTSSAMPATPPVPAGSTSFDYDGDGKADTARFRSSTGAWEIKYSGNNTTTSDLLAPGKLAPADYDGDGSTDLTSFNNGTWTVRYSSTGQKVQLPFTFGQAGDVPVSGNYAGSSAIDLAVYRPSNGTWYVREAVSGTVTSTQFGAAGDIAAPGNYDGDGVMDFAVFRPSNGYWYILGSASGFYTFSWGIASDIPVAADYDGDGKTDCAVYRASSGTWYAAKSSAPGQYVTETWGNYGDQPVPADYDNDGKADFSVYRPTSGVWHTKKSTSGAYEFTALGTPQDTAVSSAYIKQVGGQVVSYDMAKTRLSPKNATGGTDLYSRNFGWSSSLVGLSGRAGLDMGFGISYNSLIWTKHTDLATNSSTMYFDVDNSNVSPGFRFGFPTIEPVYYDSQTAKFSYLMVSPSGARTEFKQIGASDIYETVDSSYVQLKTKNANGPNDPVENISITVTGTNGAKMTYNWKGGAFRASEIKDRNGNFITINHDEYGLLQTVTDTLGRIVTVEYDSQLYPTAVKQTWKNNNGQGSDVTHYWARFEYSTIAVNPGFDGSLGIYGPTGGAPVKVLSKIKGADESSTVFEYQANGFGQVSKIRSFAADNHELNYVQTNLASPGTNLTDCPRLSQTKSWAENFNNNQEIVINNTLSNNQSYSLPNGHSGTAAKIEVSMANHPHGAISKTFVGESGWREALPIASEDWANGTSGSERKRWTWTNWTQDDANLSYILNPRVIESKVGDTANIKRSTTEYRLITGTSIAEYGLVSAANVYDTDQSTILKRAETDYNLNSTYVSRRIIGLPSETRSYGVENGALALASKATFAYDEEDFTQETNQNISSVIQHDNAGFSSSFITGRGNLTSSTRWNVDLPTTPAAAATSKVRYDIAGSAVAQIDPLNRKIRIEYADAFNDTTASRNTFAYPTKVFDAADKFSIVQYRFDTGANVRAKSPDLTGNILGPGKETYRLYDAIGRLSKETLVNTGAYTRYQYPANGIQSQVFSIVTDANGSNSVDAGDEVYSESWADGAGRVRYSRTTHPNSATGWSAAKVEYDILGRAFRSTVPTEIDPVNPDNPQTWIPAGDDNRGLDSNNNPVWLWNSQEYDWQSRTTRSIPSDSNGADGKDQLFSYDGCGCAGGQVTIIQSESVPRDDQPNTKARRTQKLYADILGRNYKTEVMNWDGFTPYTTTVQTFNKRDQVTKTRQYSGAATSSTFQDVSMTYDGHGRVKTRHYPIEDAATDTTWIYNPDDSVQQIIDPRGAITNFTYDSVRGLLTQISYQVPGGSTIPVTPTVSFSYNALGNRTQMTDGLGSVSYEYSDLSQLIAETRRFNDNLPEAPLDANNQQAYRLEYGYNVSGGLSFYKDPFGQRVDQIYDKTGRVEAVSGTAFGDNPTGEYIGGIKYRAFGRIKQMNYKTDDNALVSMQYDNRLRVSQHQVESSAAASGYLKKAQFTYMADSKPQAMDNQVNDHFDRTFRFDQAGRLTNNQVGNLNASAYPYRQNVSYDAFSQMIGRQSWHWGDNDNFSSTFVNGRKQPVAFQVPVYDAAGNLLDSDYGRNGSYQKTEYDAANRPLKSKTGYRERMGMYSYWKLENETEQIYDGDGRPLKIVERKRRTDVTPQPENHVATKYQVYSSVLGNTITEMRETGAKSITKVFAGGAVVAEQLSSSAAYQAMKWIHADPVTGSSDSVPKSGLGEQFPRVELEPLGQEIQPNEPPLEAYLPGEVPRYSTSSSEWLCRFSEDKGYWQMPTSCQMAFLTRNQFQMLEWLSSNSENNPDKIELTDSPMPKIGISPSDKILTYALKSTAKDSKGDDEGDGCKYDEEGRPECAVESEKWIEPKVPEVPGFVGADAENGGNYTTLNLSPDLGKLRDSFNTCAIGMFGVELLDGSTWAGKGSNGELKFKPLEGTTVSVYGLIPTAAKSFSIYTDATTYLMDSKFLNGVNGMAFSYEGTEATGIYESVMRARLGNESISMWTNKNVVASDRERGTSIGQRTFGAGLGINGFIHSQIHEAGNSLSILTGKNPDPAPDWKDSSGKIYKIGVGNKDGSGDSDNGLSFESCVIRNYRQ